MVDEQYRMACGPIAVYVALRRIGHDTPLENIIKSCSWVEGQEVKFDTLVKVLNLKRGIKVRAVRLSPEQLIAWMDQGGSAAAILPVRKFANAADHALCVVGVNENRLRIVDYPELTYDSTAEKLSDVWSGEAILISEIPSTLESNLGLAIIPGLIAGLVATLFVRSGATSRRKVDKTETRSIGSPLA
jgi:hypothetical protein